MASDQPILESGKTCWRRVQARRLAFLIDGDSYYLALSRAIEKARHSIWIIGWDTDSRTRLRPEEDFPELEGELKAQLDAHASLQVRILSWDFAMLYSLEREIAPLFRLRWSGHPRLHFRLDGYHPLGASQHQKIVVVDDKLAFTGGLDLTKCRWDTSEHNPEDPRRIDPEGCSYEPFHDVQVAVDGEVAHALAGLVRERWKTVTGENIPLNGNSDDDATDPWPVKLEPDALDIEVGIARTFPSFKGREEVREVEALYLESIRAARRFIYIENQYLTSRAIGNALVERLQEPDGPEVVMVIPETCTGWLEERTMGTLREGLLRRLRNASESRFRAYYPAVVDDNGKPCGVFVHSKVMVVDDHLARVGSANLSNRSMGLDSECDLAVETAVGDSLVVARFRNRLLSEHLGVKIEVLTRTQEAKDSLIETVESLRGKGRSLVPIEPVNAAAPEETEDPAPEPIEDLADPEQPIEADLLVEDFVEDTPKKFYWIGAGALLLPLIGLALAWRYTSLGDWLTLDRISQWLLAARDSIWAPVVVVGGYVLGTILLVPLGLLILATAATFDTGTAIVFSLLGTLSGGVATFGLGSFLGRDVVRRVAGARLNRISKKLARRGILTVVSIRLVPLAPYAIVNLVAGATHLSLRDFLLGTLIGVLPGILALTIFETTVERAIREADAMSIALAVAVGAAVVCVGLVVQRLLSRK